MFLAPFIWSFKITLSSKLSMYYFSQVIIPSLALFLCKFTTATNNMIYTSSAFLHTLHKESPWLLSIFALTRFVLILWFWTATIRLSVCLFFFYNIINHKQILTKYYNHQGHTYCYLGGCKDTMLQQKVHNQNIKIKILK